MYSTVNEIRLMTNISYSGCMLGLYVLDCLEFLHLVQFSLINNQYVEPNSSAHLCRFLNIFSKFSLV